MSEWDVVPQLQVTLSKLQHVMVAAGVRIPLTQREERPPQAWSISCGIGSTGASSSFGNELMSVPCSVVVVGLARRRCSRHCTPTLPSRRRPGRRRGPTAHAEPSMFAPSSDCLACHNNLVAPEREDVSIGASWRGSIMANAARDPYFQPACAGRRSTIRCGPTTLKMNAPPATCRRPEDRSAGGQAGSLRPSGGAAGACVSTDGMARTACRAPSATRSRPTASARRKASTGISWWLHRSPNGSGARFGPSFPDAGRRRIMHSVTGFEQEQAAHIRESELCATCHTLITEALGPDGPVIGSLPEQMNYQEWRHSAFSGERRSCQSCHMPPRAVPCASLRCSVTTARASRVTRSSAAMPSCFD